MLRGQVRAMEAEWDSIRDQIRKGYQRMEKANERSEKRKTMEEETPEPELTPELTPSSWERKLQQIRGKCGKVLARKLHACTREVRYAHFNCI